MCQAILDIKEDARNEGKLEVALNLLKMGEISIDKIAAVTGLSLEEIKKLSLTKY